MTEQAYKQIRKTFITLLDDEDGINEMGYNQLVNLMELLDEDGARGFNDLYNAVRATNGRYYLPENHGIKP